MINMTRQEIRKQLPDECATTLDHALVHLNSAIEATQFGDDDQVAHDANMASLVLRHIVLEFDEGKPNYPGV